MKIPQSFSQVYEASYPAYERLRDFFEPRLREIANNYNGSYSQRIKSKESLLIKAEKEGLENPFTQLDDLFACTITVITPKYLNGVITDVGTMFNVIERRQRNLKPNQFDYDDINLTLQINTDDVRKGDVIASLHFELQVKTLLQYAWSQASHDVIYKAKRKTWGLTRIASQIRALLEIADSVLENLESAANAFQPEIDYEDYEKTNRIVELIEQHWDEQNRPQNIYRAAQIVETYMGRARINIDQLHDLLEIDHYQPYITARSLTPTEVIFILLFLEQGNDFIHRFRESRILVTNEMLDLCPALSRIPEDLRVKIQPISV